MVTIPDPYFVPDGEIERRTREYEEQRREQEESEQQEED